MFNNNTDKEWEKFGKNDPYYGVLTHDKFKRKNLTEESMDAFFHSGFSYIDNIIGKIKKHIDPTFTINNAMDFGCGVGRLIIPLSKISKNVTGVDVSDSMLVEARKNCRAKSIDNVTLIKSDDSLSTVNDNYDFIHSYIVFQHIPVKRGEIIFSSLLSHLKSGGVCVVHFTFAKESKLLKLSYLLKKYIPTAKYFINLVIGHSFFSPQMQMNTYNLNRLFFTIQKNNISNCYSEFTNHGGVFGIVILFQKP